MRNKITLLGMRDIQEFVNICANIDSEVVLYCPVNGYRVSAKSLLGAIASMEWNEVWVECDKDIYSSIEKFIKVSSDSTVYHS
jgi:hypothetical protein